MTNLIEVGRYLVDATSESTLSKISVNGTNYSGFAIEDIVRAIKVKGKTAINAGRYLWDLRKSPKLSSEFLWSKSYQILIHKDEKKSYGHIKDFEPHLLIWVRNVENFEFIYLHWGNYSSQTEGCLLVGENADTVSNPIKVTNSRIFYKKIYPYLYKEIKKGNQYINYTWQTAEPKVSEKRYNEYRRELLKNYAISILQLLLGIGIVYFAYKKFIK